MTKPISRVVIALITILTASMIIHMYHSYQVFISHPEWSAPLQPRLVATAVPYLLLICLITVLGVIYKKTR
ncbi:hypothetical protein [Priestia koreensis]|uniref:Uncharacterized protein n=1 Tax=Priestia koreensis TaxID=284581 RepID=A0A0M0L991_9BACI|nr:hypothetical protein [Priestia koreensis]KOO47594.1 hypothetical protein AMD01_06030 [Priestia koreensis]MCM3006205.1 hypothetical protein [Priestia koreensis]